MEGCNGGCNAACIVYGRQIARSRSLAALLCARLTRHHRAFFFTIQSLAFYQRRRRLTRPIKFIRRCATDLLLSILGDGRIEGGGCITTGFLSLFDESWSQRAPACKLSSHLIKSRPSVKRCFFEGKDPLTRRVSAIIAVYLYDSITNFLFSTVAFPLLSSLLQHFDFWKILKSRLKFERS